MNEPLRDQQTVSGELRDRQRNRERALERLARELDTQFARMQTTEAEEATNRFFEMDTDELGAIARLRADRVPRG